VAKEYVACRKDRAKVKKVREFFKLAKLVSGMADNL